MKKMNNKGYMLVEIIMAFAITFTLLYFMMDLVLKMKNNNDDLLVETVVKTDSTIITNGLMEYAKNVTNKSEAQSFCSKIEIGSDKKTVKYAGNVIDVIDDNSLIDSSGYFCNFAEKGRLKVRIPVKVKQMKDENFDIILDYRYDSTASCNPVMSYRCKDESGNWKNQGSEPYAIDYDGRCEVIDDGGENWRIKFLTSGTLKTNCDMNVDAFLVGGGGGGGIGGGGGGGYTQTSFVNINDGKTYSIDIGDGGASMQNGKNTSAFGAIAFGGEAGKVETGGAGGSGGGGGDGGSDGGNGQYYYSGNPRYGGTGQGYTTREFGESTGFLYAGGGGGVDSDRGSGGGGVGSKGGGGGSGAANTGGGGGDYAVGGSGIVVIRNSRISQSNISKLPGVDFDFSYSGAYVVESEGSGNWKIKFLTDGTFKTSKNMNIDVFLVGGGGGGGYN